MALLLLMSHIKLRRSHWRKRFPCVRMCCLLHNFVRERDGFGVETHYSEEVLYHLDSSSTKQPKMPS